METVNHYIRQTLAVLPIYIRHIIKWLGMAVLVGVLCGGIGSAFHIGVELATEFRLGHSFMLYLLPAAGLLIVAVYHLARTDGQGTDNILEEVQKGQGLPLMLLPSIFLSTVLTHLCGGSAGREGAALQMGGTIGYHMGRLLHMDDKDSRIATMTGMAAFFAALFGTPLAATIFAMEVVSVGLIYHMALIPCLTAALLAYGVSWLAGIAPTHFLVAAPELHAFMLIRVGVLAVLCAFLSNIFCDAMRGMHVFFAKKIPNPWQRAFIGGLMVIVLTFLARSGDYNGAGMPVITAAVEEGRVFPTAFLWKILFTAVTLGAGFKGGEVVPSFFVGAAFGCIAGPLVGVPAGFAAAIGLISVFCGAVNAPIASIFLSVELFGAEGILFFALSCGLSFVFSGYNGLYSSQRILYSKLKAQFIDVHTNAHITGEMTEAERQHPH